MENLNKENFWNELFAQYPQAVQEFCNWIDKYKEANNWNQLFNVGIRQYKPDYTKAPAELAHDVKFHDLPIAMQTGIWIQFVQERGGCEYEVELFSFDLREEITGYIKMMQETQLSEN